MENIFAYRLKSIRLMNGFSQQQVANAVGVSKQLISQYEHAQKNPDSTTLIALSGFFNKPSGYFYRPLKIKLNEVEFRKHPSLQGKSLESIKATINNIIEPYLELENIMGIEPQVLYKIEEMVVNRVEIAEDVAKHLIDQWELGYNPIPNVLELLEDHGVKVVEVDLDEKFDGLSTYLGMHGALIVLNRGMSSVRKRFTALHELGHLVLKMPEGSDKKFKEQACNRFAGSMLLPAGILTSILGSKRSNLSIAELIPIKAYYGISIASIIYRCQELNILPQAVCNRFWNARKNDSDLMFERGYGSYNGEEKAYRFEQLLAKGLSEELISISKAAELSGKSVEAIRSIYQVI